MPRIRGKITFIRTLFIFGRNFDQTSYMNLSERELLLYGRKNYNGGVNEHLYFLLS